jgi:hypothetical protein
MPARTLFLTTPMMVGDDVRALQRALKNPARPDLKDDDFLQSPAGVDGEFGEDTHRAVFRAKYWLGYANPDHRAAEKLISFLNGVTPPTPRMKGLRKKRVAKQKEKTPGFRKLEEAVKHLGLKESPAGTNRVMFTSFYDMPGPWCAMFVTFCGVKAGLKSYAKRPPGRWAYVPFMVDDARAGRNQYTITNTPVTGDDVALDFPPRDGKPDHVGIFATERDLRKLNAAALNKAIQRFGALKSNEFWSVEGNTMVGNDSNGGEVMLRKRRKADVVAFMHPGV